MTYCVGIQLDDGLIMVADTRTNAGVDNIATFRKLYVFQKPGERVLMLSTSGNLATSQRVISIMQELIEISGEVNLFNVPKLFHAAELIGSTMTDIVIRQQAASKSSHVDFSSHFLLSGQIAGQEPELYHIYAEGNFIQATRDTPFFQIGESKYGKPILDRVIRCETSLNQAMKCALISFDSTMHSNLSVGMPLDLAIYRKNSLEVALERLEVNDKYFAKLRTAWGGGLLQVFDQLP